MSHNAVTAALPIVPTTQFALGTFAMRAARQKSLHLAVLFGGPEGRVGRWSSDRLVGSTHVRCELVTVFAGMSTVSLLQVNVQSAELEASDDMTTDGWRRIHRVILRELEQLICACA